MQCPVDNETLVMPERSGVEIDYCPKCRGDGFSPHGQAFGGPDEATRGLQTVSMPKTVRTVSRFARVELDCSCTYL